MNLLRKYKIHKFTPCLSEHDFKIIDFINMKLSNLMKYEKFYIMIFYMNKDGLIIFEHNIKDNSIWISGKNLYDILLNTYNMKHADINYFIFHIIKNKYDSYIINNKIYRSERDYKSEEIIELDHKNMINV